MSKDAKTIWGRRVVLMAVVALLVAVPVTLVARDDEDEPPTPEPVVVTQPELGPTEYDRKLGVEFDPPIGWDQRRRKGVLALESADGSARVAISAPGPAKDAGVLRKEFVDNLDETFDRVRVVKQIKRAPVGDLEGGATAVAARLPKKSAGGDIRVLATTAKGKKRAYLVVVFTPAPNPGPAALEAQALLNSLKFVG